MMPTQFLESHTLSPRALTRQILFNHMLAGAPLGIYKPAKGAYVDYTILGISLESGFTPPAKPTCFNLMTNHGEVFVRTLP